MNDERYEYYSLIDGEDRVKYRVNFSTKAVEFQSGHNWYDSILSWDDIRCNIADGRMFKV